MKYKGQKIILLIGLGLFSAWSSVLAKNFTIYNAQNVNQPYFSVNGTSGNVGIGLTNPSTLLQLTNNNWISAINGAGTGVVNMFKVNANNQIEVGAPLNIGSFEFSEDSGLVTFADMPVSAAPTIGTPESYIFKVDGSNILSIYSEADGAGGIQNKRVGVGTSSPLYTLDVAGAGNFNNNIIHGVGTPLIASDAASKGYIDSALSATGASLWASSTAGIFNVGLGNVGIGTTNPLATLDVLGTGTTSSTSSFIARNSSGSALLNVRNDGRIFTPAGSGLTIGGTYASQALVVYGSVYATGGGWYLDNNNSMYWGNSNTYIRGSDSTGLVIGSNSTNKIVFDGSGNLGIATSTPLYKLDVNGAGNFNSNLVHGIGTPLVASDAAPKSYVDSAISATGASLWASSTAGTYNVGLGNVGIGITNPANNLDIFSASNAHIKISGGSTGYTDADLILQANTDTDYRGLGTFLYQSPSQKEWFVGSPYADSDSFIVARQTGLAAHNATTAQNGYAVFKITSAGNVGIGTTSPQYKLDVNGTGSFNQPIIVGTPTIGTNAATKNYVDSAISVTGASLWASSTSGTYNVGLGNVGIGTVTPNAALTVNGAVNILNETNLPTVASGSNGLILSGYNPTNSVIGRLYVGDGTGYQFNFSKRIGSVTTDLVTVRDSGNVGIGTTNPTQRLEVNGLIRSTSGGENVFKSGSDTSYIGLILTRTNEGTNSDWEMGVAGAAGQFSSTAAQGDVINRYQNNYLFSNGANERLRITAAGNIGLGTTSPQYKLDVNGTGSFNQPIVVGTPTAANQAATKNYVDSLIGGGSGSTVGYWTMNGANINSSNSGNVGVGTTAPSQKLEVNGTIQADNGVLANNGLNVTGISNMQNLIFPFNTVNTAYSTSSYPSIYSTSIAGSSYPFLSNGNLVLQGRSGSTVGDIILATGSTASPLLVATYGGNVGIGTTNPAYKLDVNGGFNAAFGYGYSINTNLVLQQLGGSLITGFPYNANIEMTNLNVFNFRNNTSTKMTIDGSGNVGISTTSPLYKLDLNGAGNLNTYQIHGVGTPTAAADATPKSYVDSAISATGASLWASSTAGTYNVGLGNVGIGTTNPAAKLTVSGTDNKLRLTYDGNASTSVDIISNASGQLRIFPVSGSTYLYGGGVKNYLYTYDFSNSRSNYSALSSDLLALQNTSNLTTVSINAGSSSYFNGGNVGIGTTTPAQKLQIVGGATTDAANTITNSNFFAGGSGDFGVFIRQISTGTGISGSNWANQIIGNNGNAFEIYSQGGQPLVLGTNSTEKMRITASGNVGIGITNPTTKLQVNDATAAIVTAVSGTRTIKFGAYSGDWNYNTSLGAPYLLGTQDAQPFYIYTSNLSRLTVDIGGNVGIGTTSPQYKLDVNGAGNFNSNVVHGIGTPLAASDAVPKSYVDSSVSGSSFWASNGTNINNSNSGNVGIGTTNPTAVLNIVKNDYLPVNLDSYSATDYLRADLGFRRGRGTAAAPVVVQNNDWLGSFNFWGTNSSGTFSNPSASFVGYVDGVPGGLVTPPGRLAFLTSGDGNSATEKMTIKGSGNVGIGTTAPGEKLEVAGNVLLANNDYLRVKNTGGSAINVAGYGADNNWYFGDSGVNSNLRIGNNLGYVYVNTGGNVGIATTNPQYILDVNGSGNFNGNIIHGLGTPLVASDAAPKSYVDSAMTGAANTFWASSTAGMYNVGLGNVGIGKTNPAKALDVIGDINASVTVNATSLCIAGSCKTDWSSFVPVSGGVTLTGPLTIPGLSITSTLAMNSNNVTGVNKLTASVIDPLYSIDGKKYSTFALSVAGGLKEEYVGKTQLTNKNKVSGEFETTIDFDNLDKGSDLWVWRKVIEFNKDSVEVLVTPYGQLAQVYYVISGDKLIFRSDKPVEISYRLIAKRFDAAAWPTLAHNQAEETGLIIKD